MSGQSQRMRVAKHPALGQRQTSNGLDAVTFRSTADSCLGHKRTDCIRHSVNGIQDSQFSSFMFSLVAKSQSDHFSFLKIILHKVARKT